MSLDHSHTAPFSHLLRKLGIDTALLIIALVLASIMLGIALCNFVGH
jgi:hypothetical protein